MPCLAPRQILSRVVCWASHPRPRALAWPPQARIGDTATIRALTTHREGYITEHDFISMASQGIK